MLFIKKLLLNNFFLSVSVCRWRHVWESAFKCWNVNTV